MSIWCDIDSKDNVWPYKHNIGVLHHMQLFISLKYFIKYIYARCRCIEKYLTKCMWFFKLKKESQNWKARDGSISSSVSKYKHVSINWQSIEMNILDIFLKIHQYKTPQSKSSNTLHLNPFAMHSKKCCLVSLITKKSDNNIWLGVDRAEVSSLKKWWNGSRRGNREFSGFFGSTLCLLKIQQWYAHTLR